MASGLVDEVKKMKEDVEALRNAARGETTSEEDGERLEMVLEDLIERVENVDNAGDLHTIGGMEALIGTMKCSLASVRALAAEALATMRMCTLAMMAMMPARQQHSR